MRPEAYVAGMQRGRPPQDVDVDELGGDEWQRPILGRVDGFEVWLPREGPPRKRERPASRRRLAWILGLLAALGLLLAVTRGGGWDDLSAEERAATEARLSAEASRIAGHPARVHCDVKGENVGIVQHADGLAEVGGTNAYLTPELCFRLREPRDDSRTARAIAVLGHEAWHLYGIRDEGEASCRALRSGIELGVGLGLSEAQARRMMRQQLAENAIQARAAPEYLVPAGCSLDR